MRSFLDIVEEIKTILSLEIGSKKVYDKDIADRLGISQMNFATMKKRNKIPFDEILDFCALKSISINWMLYGQSPESLIDTTNRFFMVRYFSEVNASAGGGGDAQDEEERMLEIPSEFATLLGGANELRHIEALNVSGDSMEPLFSYDDIVFVNKNKTNIQRGGVFVIKTESGLFIKRVWQRVDGAIELISENSVYPVQVLRADAVEVVGRVVGKFGGVD